MRRFSGILLFSLINHGFLSAQQDYYSRGSTLFAGIKLVEGIDLDNCKYCMVKKGEQVIKYSPYEVNEYGFKNGRVYFSRVVKLPDSTCRVFLERLNDGDTKLYYYRGYHIKTFFLENDSSALFELPRQSVENKKLQFQEDLARLTSDCQPVADVARYVKYKKRSLSKYIARYDACINKPFPHFKYGIIAGFDAMRLDVSENADDTYLKIFDYKFEGSFMGGFFIDQPIVVSDISLHAEIIYNQNRYSYNYRKTTKDYDLLISTSSLTFPVLIRYTYPTGPFTTYMNLGGVYSFYVRNENGLYEATLSHDVIEINTVKYESLLSDHQLGYSAGAGIEYNFKENYSLFLELRYNKQYGLADDDQFNTSKIQIFAGISL